MVGIMPKTALLLVSSGVVQGHFTNYSELTRGMGISVDMDTGWVTFMGKRQGPQYSVKDDGMVSNNHWKTADDIIRDWSRYHLELPSGYKIYRYLT
jgi:Ni/Co efflux regulator RcnB